MPYLLEILLIAFQCAERQVTLMASDRREDTAESEEIKCGLKGGLVSHNPDHSVCASSVRS